MVSHHLRDSRASLALCEELGENPHLQAGHIAMLGRMAKSLPAEVNADLAIRQQHHALHELLQLPVRRTAMRSALGEFDTEFLNADQPVDSVIERVRQRGAARIALYGPPGTGKTAFGHALAKALDRPLQICTSADLLSKWLGDTERLIVEVFARATREGSVLMLDEVDSLLMRREDADRHWQISQVNELLNALDHFRGVVVLTTNRFDALDRAVLRRLDFKLALREPTATQRIALWQRLCTQQQWHVGAADCERIRDMEGLTPGDFHLVARHYLERQDGEAKADALRDLQHEWKLKSGKPRTVGFVAPNTHYHA
jgi:transitional endoplasmic reticulum ATPase